MNRQVRLVKTILLPLFVFSFFISDNTEAQTAAPSRQRLSMDFNWKFQLGDPKNADQKSFDDSTWRMLNLPHDWSIEGEYNKDAPAGGSGGYLPTGIGWYRRHFHVEQSDLTDLKKKIWIEFDGIYMNSDVWINGRHVGNYPYGYSSFYYDATPYLNEGENVVAVRVDNSLQPNTRWYTGSGIYRHVWLVIVDPLHVGHWGMVVTTPKVSAKSATIDVKTEIENNHDAAKKATLRTILTDSEGKEVARTEKTFSVKPNRSAAIRQQVVVASPQLWSVDSPVLYKLHSVVLDGKKLVDEVTTDIGIRSIHYDVDKGFFLNGKHIKMNGVCLHHDGGCVGAAVPEQVWERRLLKLKEMGCNAIRTSHNPPAPEFLDMCDRMGFLVMDEAFDEWKIGKRDHGYHEYFDTWAQQDLTTMLRRDRNHPSIVLWSVGNEIPEQKSANGDEMLRALMETCRREDPTRLVTSACDNIVADNGATTLDFLKQLDIVGYNYVDRWHERRELFYGIDRHDHPDWKMIGAENTSNWSVRGEYSLGDDSSKVHAGYNFSMINSEQLWKFTRIRDYVIGDFMWTGIDYLGEARWPHKSASFGVLDLCGFPKDGFYFYQSQWTEQPMVHLFPHWNWSGRDGQVIPVFCYTNCDVVELFLNGKSFGEKRLEFPRQGNSGAWNRYDKPLINPTTADLHLQWDVPYAAGVLKAVGKKDGKIVATQEIRTTGKSATVKLTVDRNTLNAGAREIAHVEVRILDAEGNIVPTADDLVKFIIEGEGKIVGVDNGNPTDHDSYKLSQRKAFNGMCLALVQSTMNTGKIKFTATADGLKAAVVEISVKKGVVVSVLQ